VALLLALTAAPLHAQWITQASGTASEFRGLHAVSDRVVWAAGKGGVVALTEDGGATWRADSIPGAAGLFLIAVGARDARRAWVAGTAFSGPSLGRIYRTDDGGRHWEQQYENAAPGVFLDGMAFWDERHGIAFGDPIGRRLLVLTTQDGGAHWTPLAPERAPAMAEGEAAFAASGTAIFVRGKAEVWIATGGGPHARVLHSRDRGASWEAVDTPATGAAAKGLFGIAMGSGGRGVAVGGDYRQRDASTENLLLTGDGGKKWRLATSPGLAGVQYGVAPAGGGVYLAAGPTGSARSADDGNTWTRLEGAGFNTVSCARGSCWGAGVDGRIARLVIR
jgi:photosystem II stability/assembly factor-like uncharacterized protein